MANGAIEEKLRARTTASVVCTAMPTGTRSMPLGPIARTHGEPARTQSGPPMLVLFCASTPHFPASVPVVTLAGALPRTDVRGASNGDQTPRTISSSSRRQKVEDITVRADDRKHPALARLRSSAHTAAYSEVRPSVRATVRHLFLFYGRPTGDLAARVSSTSFGIPKSSHRAPVPGSPQAGSAATSRVYFASLAFWLRQHARNAARSGACVCFALPRPSLPPPSPCLHRPAGVAPIPVRSFATPPFPCPILSRLLELNSKVPRSAPGSAAFVTITCQCKLRLAVSVRGFGPSSCHRSTLICQQLRP
ncbi:hypothetical protein C8Q74DRAFT_427622 [Fomes fomentarius]|nr:hypothetical protein C8Q74DRAFT_427622 [Fomes fomentarius]